MQAYEIITVLLGTGIFGVVLDTSFKLGHITTSLKTLERRIEKLEKKQC
tara:strand:- start:17852 stop:17998 length:147 start_codon:yes stop_codon:yes gene_type:complete